MRLTIFFLLLLSFTTNAQYLHTPVEIEEIKNQSRISYQHDSVVPSLSVAQRSVLTFPYENLLHPDLRASIETNNKGEKYLKKATNYYLDKNYKQAINYFTKLEDLQQAPEVMIWLADCYQQIQAPDEAIRIYESLLEKDSSNAFLYFQLSNCYRQKEEYNMACQLITMAHLYNRNNPVYQDSLAGLYRLVGLRFRELDFDPKYELYQMKDSLVHIKATASPWVAYATCKGIWAYEPGYREKMNHISSSDSRIIEEKECLFNALCVFEKLEATDKIDYPGLYTLARALPEGRIDDFIMYEISLPNHPEIAVLLGKGRMDRLVDYVYTYRVKKVEVSQ